MTQLDEQCRQESGHINLGLIFISMIFTISVVLGIAGLAVATNSAQGNQNAADAAALAGAEAFDPAGALYFATGFSTEAELRTMVRRTGGCPALVRTAAATYASKNDASLESCRMLRWGDVEVTTRANVPLDGARDSRRSARATWDLDLSDCEIDPAFIPPVTGVTYTFMRCDGHRIGLLYVVASARYFVQPWMQINPLIEPQLTQ